MALEEVDARDVDAKQAAEFLRDEMLRVIKSELPEPWQKMSEAAQERTISRVENIAVNTVHKAVQAIATVGRHVVVGTLGPLSTDKKGNPKLPITIDIGIENEDKLAIWDHIGRSVHLVLMDVGEYTNFQTKQRAEPDQASLPVEPALATEKQPDWAEVGEAISAPPAETRVQVGKKPDDPDAHEAEDDEDGMDDVVDDDMSSEEVSKLIDIPNPTTKATPKKK